MVFLPPWSAVLVNKSEVLPKSLDKQGNGETRQAGTGAGKGGAHEPGLQTALHTCRHCISSSTHSSGQRDSVGCPMLHQEVYLVQLYV